MAAIVNKFCYVVKKKNIIFLSRFSFRVFQKVFCTRLNSIRVSFSEFVILY